MKNFLTQYGLVFRFINSTKNLLLKFLNPHVLIGADVIIKGVKFEKRASLGEGVRLIDALIGNHTYIAANSLIRNTSFGRFCSVGSGVKTGLGVHPTSEFISTHPAFYSLRRQSGKTFAKQQHFKEEKRIEIGNDVWIGSNAIVLDGVVIGNGAIIAAGAVVTENVAPFEIVGGVPAKHIRFRFSEQEIEAIEKSEWWNQDEAWLKNNAERFLKKEDFFRISSHK